MPDPTSTEDGLRGRVALVTGGAAGIGRAVSLALGAAGADVAVLDVNAAGAGETARMVTGNGSRGRAISADVADYEAVRTALEEIRAELGEPLIVVSNAGIAGQATLFRNETKDNWKRLFEVHVDGAYHCLRETLDPMIAAGWGRIVCISSVAARMGWRGGASYAAAKGALLGLVHTLALETASKGITVNAVLPGVIETAMSRKALVQVREHIEGAIPMGRVGRPEDIAQAVAYLCSEKAAYLTGQSISPNGGLWMP